MIFRDLYQPDPFSGSDFTFFSSDSPKTRVTCDFHYGISLLVKYLWGTTFSEKYGSVIHGCDHITELVDLAPILGNNSGLVCDLKSKTSQNGWFWHICSNRIHNVFLLQMFCSEIWDEHRPIYGGFRGLEMLSSLITGIFLEFLSIKESRYTKSVNRVVAKVISCPKRSQHL